MAVAPRIHSWLNRHYPRTHICENCGEGGPTELAFLWHPSPHTKNFEDYEELCPPCHREADRQEVSLRRYIARWKYQLTLNAKKTPRH